MQLLHNVENRIGMGFYNIKITPNGGTADIQYSVSDEGMLTIPDSLNNGPFDVNLPACGIRAVITGGATVHINLTG